MAAQAWQIHDGWFTSLHNGTVDTDTDVFAMRLYTQASNIVNTSINALASITDELAAGNGYATGGATVAVTISEPSAGVTRLDCADAIWAATGTGIVARYGALVDVTAGVVVAHCLLDVLDADVTASAGNPFTIEIAATGVYTVTQV
jgi:hypothetical protein